MKRFNLRRIGLVLIDAATTIIACLAAVFVLNELTEIKIPLATNWPVIGVFMLCTMAGLVAFGVYKTMWRFAQMRDFYKCIGGLACGTLAALLILTLSGRIFSRIFVVFSYFIALCGVIILRTGYSWMCGFLRSKSAAAENTENTLIVGAGKAAYRMISEIKESPCGYQVVCAVDDDIAKINTKILGVPVLGRIDEIPEICRRKAIKTIIIAIPSCGEKDRRRIVDTCQETDCAIKTLPYIHELLDMESLVKQTKSIQFEDLLGRGVIKFDNTNVKNLISDRVCMVTGGGGSIGSELCRQIAKYNPSKLIIVDIYENNAYDIQQELKREYEDKIELHTEIASVRDYQKIDSLFGKYKPQLVFHAAAHKHVPLMETNPEEAVKNNIIGTFNVATLADLYKAEEFLLISTDKAVNPTNVMGATKRCCEMIVQVMAQNSKNTKFNTVRFGNVLGSNGSVIPLFEKQIENGGPVTVTDPEIIRYFMTIPEAVSLILQAATQAKGGEIFVLDMGEPVKILSLAENLIKMHGKKPYSEIEIKFTGLRPGEKLYEELLMDEEGLKETENKKIFIGKQLEVDEKKLTDLLYGIKDAANSNDKNSVIDILQDIVPTFNHNVIE